MLAIVLCWKCLQCVNKCIFMSLKAFSWRGFSILRPFPYCGWACNVTITMNGGHYQFYKYKPYIPCVLALNYPHRFKC